MHVASCKIIINTPGNHGQASIVTCRLLQVFIGIEPFTRISRLYPPSRRYALGEGLSFEPADLCRTVVASRNVPALDDIGIDDQHLGGPVLLLQFKDQPSNSWNHKRTGPACADDDDPQAAVFSRHHNGSPSETEIDLHHNII